MRSVRPGVATTEEEESGVEVPDTEGCSAEEGGGGEAMTGALPSLTRLGRRRLVING